MIGAWAWSNILETGSSVHLHVKTNSFAAFHWFYVLFSALCLLFDYRPTTPSTLINFGYFIIVPTYIVRVRSRRFDLYQPSHWLMIAK